MMEEQYGADIARGMEVQDRSTRRQRPRIVVGVWEGFVYMRHADNPWSVDVARAETFWDRFREVDG